MSWGLMGSGNSYVRTFGPQTVTGPITFVSDGSATGVITVRGLATDPLKQLIQTFDGFGNPISTNANAGGFGVLGDRLSAFPPSDIFNASFQTLTATADNVATNAAAFRFGHGTIQGAIFSIGTGAPGAANPITTGIPPNGSIYLRTDGGAGTTIYQVRAGAWVATAA